MWVGFLGSFRPLNHNLKQLCHYHALFESNIPFQFGVCSTCGWLQPLGPRQGNDSSKNAVLAKAAPERARVPRGHGVPGHRGGRNLTKASLPCKHEVPCAGRCSSAEPSQQRLVFDSLEKQTRSLTEPCTLYRGGGKRTWQWKGPCRSWCQGDNLWELSTFQNRILSDHFLPVSWWNW